MMTEEITDIADDKILLDRMKTGDRLAFEMIYSKYWSKLYIYAYNILREKHSCEDIVQEIMTDLWIRRDVLQIESLKAFFLAATRFQVLKVIRSGKVRSDFFTQDHQLPEGYNAEQAIHSKDISSIVDEHISQLPAKCREIFTLSRKEQLSNREIAKKLGIAQKTVENQITIAIRRLRSSLGDVLAFILLFYTIL